MKYLNHITLNTGHMRKTYPDEVDKKIYFVLKRILRDSLKGEGAEVYPNFILKTTQAEDATIATVYRDQLPILTTTCCKTDDGSIWRTLHESAMTPLKTKANDKLPTPYIADRIEIGYMMYMNELSWAGDFSRCFGWITLAPDQVR